MRRRPRKRQQEDHTSIAFFSAATLACVVIAAVEDVRYSATGVPLWSSWRLQPVSIFAGALSFVGLLYCLERINNRSRAVAYIEPYLPLVVLSGANVMLKLNPAWLLPVVLGCVTWSVGRVRKTREQHSTSRRAAGS
jgi:hypothetical protein